jgi:hypothetical protein
MHGVGLFDLNQSLELRLREKFGEKDGIVQLPTTMGEVMDMLHIMMPKA